MTTPKDQPRQADCMTGTERILVALNRRPVDRIPFVPLFHLYTLMDMPEEVAGKATASGFFDPLG